MSTDGDPFSAGAAEAARLAREVQDLGFEAARSIVERFVEVFAQFATANGGPGTPRRDSGPDGKGGDGEGSGGEGSGGGGSGGGGSGPGFGLWGSDRSMRALQSDMQRAADTYVGILGQLNEAGLRFLDATRWLDTSRWGDTSRWADAARWWQPAASEEDDLRLPDVGPGGRASARLWLHNTTAAAAVDLRPWCPGLATHTGASLPATAVTCAPGRIDRLDPGASREILVTVAAGEDESPGWYHGQILVDGLPDVAFPLRLRVRPDTNAS